MDTYEKIQRQVMLRANLLDSDSATAMATAYGVSNIGNPQIGLRASQFPEDAVNDAILNAADVMVNLIGLNPFSPYRANFAGTTANVSSGSLIPIISVSPKDRVGVIGDVRDSSTFKKLTSVEYQEVIGIGNLATLKQAPHYYYTDNIRIWHTRTFVVCDIVVWEKADQRALLASNPRGMNPFPQDLHEALVCGALSYLFRSGFNTEQMNAWRKYFEDTLRTLAQRPDPMELEQRRALE